MARKRPEPMQVVKQRRDAALKALVEEKRYFPGFFTFLAKDRRVPESSAAP